MTKALKTTKLPVIWQKFIKKKRQFYQSLTAWIFVIFSSSISAKCFPNICPTVAQYLRDWPIFDRYLLDICPILTKYFINICLIFAQYFSNISPIFDLYLTYIWPIFDQYLPKIWPIFAKYLSNFCLSWASVRRRGPRR